MVQHSEFKAAWWLPGRHLQTLWPSLTRRRKLVDTFSEELTLPDGDCLNLAWVNHTLSSPIVIILHGMEGSVKSPYIQGILYQLKCQGLRGVLMHFRGCHGQSNRLADEYNLFKTNDLNAVITHLQQREPHTPLAAIGYSLGGNVLLKWLGETGNKSTLSCAVAVSVPFAMHRGISKIFSGFSAFYQWHILRHLKRRLLKKIQALGLQIDIQKLKNAKTFEQFDDHITAPGNGFKNAQAYYQQSCSIQYLQHITTNTLIIQAQDDPFLAPGTTPQQSDLSPNVTLELTQKGGHVGFIQGVAPWKAQYWLETRIPAYITSQLTP